MSATPVSAASTGWPAIASAGKARQVESGAIRIESLGGAGGEGSMVERTSSGGKAGARQVLAVSGARRGLLYSGVPPFHGIRMTALRIGQGFDVHALVAGRPLIIGGVTVPFERGLDGHSDADVLLHAITDALLGAAGLGDIGRHFPDTDAGFKGADSRVLLREAVRRVREAGFSPVNIDCTIIAQAPKMAPHVSAMAAHIAADCGIAAGAVNVKAKTTERLGFTGRGEGIAAEAVVLVESR